MIQKLKILVSLKITQLLNINSDLSRLKSYFDINRLSINVTKCEFMQIGTYQSIAKMPNLTIHINNEPLKKV